MCSASHTADTPYAAASPARHHLHTQPSPNVTIQGGSPDNVVTVTKANIKAGKSIVHIIDGVLLPPMDMAPEVNATQGPAVSPAPAPKPAASPAPRASSGSAAGVAAVGAVVTALAAVVVAL